MRGEGTMIYKKYEVHILVWLITLAFFISIFLSAPSKIGAERYIEPKVEPQKGPLGYQKRDNRYEGLYERRCSASLAVVSLLRGRLHFDWNPSVVLQVRTINNPNQRINVRAVAIPLKTYYRMDGELAPLQYTLNWPIREVIYKSSLKPGDIGVFGWISNDKIERFVPLKVIQEGSIKTKDEAVTLMVRADVDVEEVAWKFSDAVNGKCLKSTEGWKKVGRFVNAGQPIKIEIPKTDIRELCVEIRAKPQTSGTWLSRRIIIQMR